MAIPVFSKDYSDPASQAWRTGAGPYQQTLGPNRGADTDPTSFKNSFVTDLRKNPDFTDFYKKNTFGSDTAAVSQQKLDTSSLQNAANFTNPLDNQLANDFLVKYSQGVSRGLIEQDRAIFPSNLAKLTTEPATAGSNMRDPNTAGQFPGQGGIQPS